VPASPEARRAAFSVFVKRAIEHARVRHGWNITQVVEATGADDQGRPRLSRSTLYRWLRGDWREDPQPGQIVALCDALDIPPESAFRILWPGKTDRPSETEPLPLDPDIEIVLRRLADPTTPEPERFFLRESLKSLAARALRPRRNDVDRTG